MSSITIVAISRSKAIHCTTLHSLMNIHMFCIIKNIHMDVHFVKDRSTLPKLIKNGDRLLFFEYGASINQECIATMCSPFPTGYQVMVFPAVKEGINWDKFKKLTTEPAGQRGLEFDTEVDRQIGESVWSVKSTEAMVWAMDCKPVDKKTRAAKDTVKLPLDSSKAFFDTLSNTGIKMCACTAARCIIHYTHECFGNILESAGINLQNGPAHS